MDNKYLTFLVIWIFIIFYCNNSIGQVEVDPVTGFPIENAQDSGPVIGAEKEDTKKTKYNFKKSFSEYYPHPKTAVYLGLAFPAGGQLYNKDYWKVPLIWGGYGYLIYLIGENTMLYRNLRDAVLIRLAGGEDMFIATIPNIPSLRSNRDAARKSLEQSYIAIIFVHLLSAAEAFVSSHLKGFDVSEDLSLQVKPAFIQGNFQPGISSGMLRQQSAGVSVQITF